MELTAETLDSIAQDLECGFIVYVNKKTGAILSVPDTEDPDVEAEAWQEELTEIKKSKRSMVVITRPDFVEDILCMKDFVDSLPDDHFRNELWVQCYQARSFKGFRSVIAHSPHRQAWFEWKRRHLARHAEDILMENKITIRKP